MAEGEIDIPELIKDITGKRRTPKINESIALTKYVAQNDFSNYSDFCAAKRILGHDGFLSQSEVEKARAATFPNSTLISSNWNAQAKLESESPDAAALAKAYEDYKNKNDGRLPEINEKGMDPVLLVKLKEKMQQELIPDKR